MTQEIINYNLPNGDGSTIEISKPTSILGVEQSVENIKMFVVAEKDAPKITIEAFYILSGDLPKDAWFAGTCGRVGPRLPICVFIREVDN